MILTSSLSCRPYWTAPSPAAAPCWTAAPSAGGWTVAWAMAAETWSWSWSPPQLRIFRWRFVQQYYNVSESFGDFSFYSMNRNWNPSPEMDTSVIFMHYFSPFLYILFLINFDPQSYLASVTFLHDFFFFFFFFFFKFLFFSLLFFFF